MLKHCARFVSFLALGVSLAQAAIMVETVDGSYAPWSFEKRAGDGVVAVRLKNNNDLSYLTSVSMGTPPQQIQMAPALSQNFISVASPPPNTNDQTFYNPTTSTSHLALDGSATVQAISGATVQGQLAGEICSLKSAISDLSFTYNASILLTDPTVTNDLYPLDARAVLGYGVNAPTDAPAGATLLGSFLPAKFTSAFCGIELNHIDDPVPDGILTMGAVDPTAFNGAFTNAIVPETSPVSWAILYDSLTYVANGTNKTVPGILSSVDLYHTGIQVTSDAAGQIYSGINGSTALSKTLWSIPCSSKFPLTLTLGNQSFTMFERDTVVKQADGSCTGIVTGGATNIGKLGAPFLRNVYTQFGAVMATDGTVTFSVGFAAKNLRQGTSTTISPQSTVGPSSTSPSTQSPSPSNTKAASGGFPCTSFNIGTIIATLFFYVCSMFLL